MVNHVNHYQNMSWVCTHMMFKYVHSSTHRECYEVLNARCQTINTLLECQSFIRGGGAYSLSSQSWKTSKVILCGGFILIMKLKMKPHVFRSVGLHNPAFKNTEVFSCFCFPLAHATNGCSCSTPLIRRDWHSARILSDKCCGALWCDWSFSLFATFKTHHNPTPIQLGNCTQLFTLKITSKY